MIKRDRLKYLLLFILVILILMFAKKPLNSCPKCGAPLDINQTARCPYCGSVVTINNEDWALNNIKGISQITR